MGLIITPDEFKVGRQIHKFAIQVQSILENAHLLDIEIKASMPNDPRNICQLHFQDNKTKNKYELIVTTKKDIPMLLPAMIKAIKLHRENVANTLII